MASKIWILMEQFSWRKTRNELPCYSIDVFLFVCFLFFKRICFMFLIMKCLVCSILFSGPNRADDESRELFECGWGNTFWATFDSFWSRLANGTLAERLKCFCCRCQLLSIQTKRALWVFSAVLSPPSLITPTAPPPQTPTVIFSPKGKSVLSFPHPTTCFF